MPLDETPPPRNLGVPTSVPAALAALLLLAACEDRSSQSADAGLTDEPLQECSQEVFLTLAKDAASRIGVASSRDRVVEQLKPFALAVHLAHAPDQRCRYEAKVRLPVGRRLIDIVYPETSGPAQTLSANIISSTEICVNYRDEVNDYEAGEGDDHSWSWSDKDDALGKRMARVFDPVCFSFDPQDP